ncbi:LLM class flavin-dependent oxidoreductase [Pseudonocardia nematodicida]|uniref:LLM class flavin-dependent oxidoreductase n=1 Tax=Pseudonocardia nematodicida TaxID=1206997 RepID=A0ABV1KGW8_9PSEU
MSAPFRFGVTAAARGPADEWVTRVRRVADLGYSTLLVPDNLHMIAPLPALAVAATAEPRLRVCPFVLAGPLRTPRTTAWEAHSLAVLTGGRFELGIGTGRPDARGEAERLGMPWGTGAQRLAGVRAAVAALRELDGDGPATRVVMAAGGPKALAAAAGIADTVFLAAPPGTPRAELDRMSGELRARAAGRDVETGMSLFAVGDDIPEEMLRWAGPGAAEALRAPDNPSRLTGSTSEMADELRRRRDELGISYLAVNEYTATALAPVVAQLSGT